MNSVVTSLALICITVILSAGFGYSLHLNNPDGIWLYTPSADGSGKPSNALYTGASLGAFLSATIYLVGFVCMFTWSKLKHTLLPSVSVPLILAAFVGFIAVVVLAGLAE